MLLADIHPALPPCLSLQSNMRGFEMGGVHLDASNGTPIEACLTLVASTREGSPVFDNLSNIRFTLDASKGPANTRQAQPIAAQEVRKGALPSKAAVLGAQKVQKVQKGAQKQHAGSAAVAKDSGKPERPGSLYAYDWITFDDTEQEVTEAMMHPFLGATPGMKRAQRDAYAAAAARKAKEGLFLRRESGSRNSSAALQQSSWDELRREYLWPDGQGVLESMFTPYESEGIYTCRRCQPDV
jgi:hypothetical protein